MLFTFESAYAAGTMLQEYFRMSFKVVLVARMLIISAQYCAIKSMQLRGKKLKQLVPCCKNTSGRRVVLIGEPDASR